MNYKINRPHINVCIVSYKRPELLNKCINSILVQYTGDEFTFSIVVVDNDIDFSAESIVVGIAKVSQIEIKYIPLGLKNISLARNKAIEYCNGDYVAFLDDDEFACDKWLCNLYKQIKLANADVVHGAVKPYFICQPKNWVLKSRFFERLNFSHGCSNYHILATSNAMVKRSVIQDLKFDEKYGISGGEDTAFFYYLKKKGYVFIWAQDALVYEHIPEERIKLMWMLKRDYRNGNIEMRIVADYESIMCKMNLLFKSAVRVLIALILTSLGALIYFFKTDLFFYNLFLLMTRLGIWAEFLRFSYLEYAE